MRTEFHADDGFFGFGSSPIALGKLLLVNVGGRPDAGIVAPVACYRQDRVDENR